MTDVVIPPDRLDAVQSETCAQWLVDHTRGSAIGHVSEGQFLVRFSHAEEAEAFSKVNDQSSRQEKPSAHILDGPDSRSAWPVPASSPCLISPATAAP
jgi:hypothetical protein